MNKLTLIQSLKQDIAHLEVSGGTNVTAGLVDKPDSCDEERKAFQKILRLAAVREQCSFELRKRLLRDGFSSDAVDSALLRAQDCGVVNDSRYSEVYVRTKLAAGKGRHGVMRDLQQKGLSFPVNLYGEDEKDDNDELDRALRLLDSKPPHGKNKRDSAYRKLLQRGYSSSIASRAACIWAEKCQVSPF